MYECTCVDFAVHATVCKHIHTVHSFRWATPPTDAQPRVPALSAGTRVGSTVRKRVKRLKQATEAVSDEHAVPQVQEVQESSESDDLPTLRHRVISQC